MLPLPRIPKSIHLSLLCWVALVTSGIFCVCFPERGQAWWEFTNNDEAVSKHPAIFFHALAYMKPVKKGKKINQHWQTRIWKRFPHSFHMKTCLYCFPYEDIYVFPFGRQLLKGLQRSAAKYMLWNESWYKPTDPFLYYIVCVYSAVHVISILVGCSVFRTLNCDFVDQTASS